MMSKVLVRVNEQTYDVVFLGVTKTEAMAIREGFSALSINQDWAYQNQGSLTEAVRANSTLAELHDEYKRTIRDVVPPVSVETYDEVEASDFEDMGFEA